MIRSCNDLPLNRVALTRTSIHRLMVCPYDCHFCADPTCRVDGCQLVEATMLLVCDECGEPVLCVNCAHVCVTCMQASPPRPTPNK